MIKVHRLVIDYPSVSLEMAVSMVRVYLAGGHIDTAVFMDHIEVSRLAPDHFLVRRVEPAE